MAEPEVEIVCPLFLKREGTIKQLIRDINGARLVSDKAEMAERLKKEVDLLLACEKYDEGNEDCINCKIISKLREQAAKLLIKVKGLGELLK